MHAGLLTRATKGTKRKTGRTSLEARPIPMLETSQVAKANPKEAKEPNAEIAVGRHTLTKTNARPKDKNAGNVAR